jgi:hypothetical protein
MVIKKTICILSHLRCEDVSAGPTPELELSGRKRWASIFEYLISSPTPLVIRGRLEKQGTRSHKLHDVFDITELEYARPARVR